MQDRPEILKKLMPRHLKVIDFILEGLTLGVIAQKVGLSVVQLKNIRNSPTFQYELSLRQSNFNSLHDQTLVTKQLESAEDIIQKNQVIAAQTLQDILASADSDNTTKIKVAESFLDRGGHPKVQKQDSISRNIIIALDAGKLELINETLNLDS